MTCSINLKIISARLAGQRGTSLVESVIAVAILATVGTAFLLALSTGFNGYKTSRESAVIDALAQSQMETVVRTNYAQSYDPTVTTPEGYSLSITVTPIYDGNLQEITVTVYQNGISKFTLKNYKANKS